MVVLTWIIVGIIAGLAFGRFKGTDGLGSIIRDVIAGGCGASLGGYLGSLWMGMGVMGLSFGSVVISAAFAALMIAAVRALAPGRKPRTA